MIEILSFIWTIKLAKFTEYVPNWLKPSKFQSSYARNSIENVQKLEDWLLVSISSSNKETLKLFLIENSWTIPKATHLSFHIVVGVCNLTTIWNVRTLTACEMWHTNCPTGISLILTQPPFIYTFHCCEWLMVFKIFVILIYSKKPKVLFFSI